MYIFLIMISTPLFFRFSFEISPYEKLTSDEIQSAWLIIVLENNKTKNLKTELYGNKISEIQNNTESLDIPKTKKYQCIQSKELYAAGYTYCYKTKIKNENEFIVYFKDNNENRSIYTVSNNKIVSAERKRMNGFILLFFIVSTSAFWILFFKCKKRYMKSRNRKNNN